MENIRPTADGQHAPSNLPVNAALLMLVLDEIDYGMLLTTSGGTLRYANRMALSEILCDGPVSVSGGQVQARDVADQDVLRTALMDATRGRRRLIELGRLGGTMSVAVLPMERNEDGAGEPLALLVFGKRRHCEALTVDFYARTRGLTSAESGVLHDLCLGATPKEIAHGRSVAISTVRTHISSIRQKTRTQSIRDLVHRVTALPPITSAIKWPQPPGLLGANNDALGMTQ
jgi:DNA-binding CsgD family transcriptional regulator